MTRRDTLTCVHEPFGDAFYFGPERLSDRYENDEKARIESGFADSTYKTIFDRIEREGKKVRSGLFFISPLSCFFSKFRVGILQLSVDNIRRDVDGLSMGCYRTGLLSCPSSAHGKSLPVLSVCCMSRLT
jgi:hypothetical protein